MIKSAAQKLINSILLQTHKSHITMTSATSEDPNAKRPIGRWMRIIQSIGAIIVTGLVLWFLFGVPAYLLFGFLFE